MSVTGKRHFREKKMLKNTEFRGARGRGKYCKENMCKRQEKKEAKERIGYKKKKKMERRKNREKGHIKEKKGKSRRKITKERI